MKRHGPDPKQGVLEQELLSFFQNEVVDDRLLGLVATRVELSQDRRHLTVYYLPEEDADAAATTAGLEDLHHEILDRAFDVLHRRPELRFKLDKGAGNQRRVEAILAELHRGPDGAEGAGDGSGAGGAPGDGTADRPGGGAGSGTGDEGPPKA